MSFKYATKLLLFFDMCKKKALFLTKKILIMTYYLSDTHPYHTITPPAAHPDALSAARRHGSSPSGALHPLDPWRGVALRPSDGGVGRPNVTRERGERGEGEKAAGGRGGSSAKRLSARSSPCGRRLVPPFSHPSRPPWGMRRLARYTLPARLRRHLYPPPRRVIRPVFRPRVRHAGAASGYLAAILRSPRVLKTRPGGREPASCPHAGAWPPPEWVPPPTPSGFLRGRRRPLERKGAAPT